MKATVMIRRLKNDVLSELPVKRRQQVSVCVLSNLLFHLWDALSSPVTIADLYYVLPPCWSQVFLDLAEKDMKQINALFREVMKVTGSMFMSNTL